VLERLRVIPEEQGSRGLPAMTSILLRRPADALMENAQYGPQARCASKDGARPPGSASVDPEDGSGSQHRPFLNVCLASARFHPVYSGAAKRFQRYAPGLRERGIELKVFTTASHGAADQMKGEVDYPGRLHPPDQVEGTPVQRVSVAGTGHRRMLTFTRALVDHCLRTKPTVLQFVQLWPLSPPWLMRLRARRLPLVFGATMFRSEHLSWLKALYASAPLALMDCIVVSSEQMRESLRGEGVRTRMEVIPNGVDLARFRPADPAERLHLRSRIGLPPDAEVIAFIGSLNARKGIDVLADAWLELSRRPTAHLVLVGPSEDGPHADSRQRQFTRRIKHELHSAPGRERVLFTGAVDDVSDYLRAADVFVFPSRREGMPNAVLEALACGIPSVLTPFPGLTSELGRPGSEFYLTEREPAAIAAAVTEILDSSALRDQLAGAGREWVQSTLDLGASLELYAALYRGLA
jgi:glycosyltransferase involved in cell wall biosynthesis